MTIKAIAAMTSKRLIGVNNTIPWQHKGDLKRFKELTTNSTVIMGRLTFESLGSKPLPNRTNIMISSQDFNIEGILHFKSVGEVLQHIESAQDIWIIGGATIYNSFLPFIQSFDVTLVPDNIDVENGVYLPEFPDYWSTTEKKLHPYNPVLFTQTFFNPTPLLIK